MRGFSPPFTIASEGYASTAARLLMARAERGEQMQLFVLHEADPDGYNIARTLQEETARMPGHSIQVVDLGLTVEAADAMDLPSETFTRQKALPEGLLLSERTEAWFTGQPIQVKDKTQWNCRRVELNAMSSRQLVDYIEQGLRTAGADSKILPAEAIVRTSYLNAVDEAISEEVNRTLDELLSPKDIVTQITADLFSRSAEKDVRLLVNQALRRRRELSWDQATRRLAHAFVKQDRSRISESVRAALYARMKELDD